jgi:hypothetical protein
VRASRTSYDISSRSRVVGSELAAKRERCRSIRTCEEKFSINPSCCLLACSGGVNNGGVELIIPW